MPHIPRAPRGPIHVTALCLILLAGCATPASKALVIPPAPFVLTVQWENVDLPMPEKYYTGLEISSNLHDWVLVRSNDYAATNSVRLTNTVSPVFIRAFNWYRSQ